MVSAETLTSAHERANIVAGGRVSVWCEPEFLRYDKGVVADRESGVVNSLTRLRRVPELPTDGAIPLAAG